MEIATQIYESGISGMDLGAIAIESFVGAAYGAISGVGSTTSSVGLRLGMRGAKVALSGLSTALHGINEGSYDSIAIDVCNSIGIGIFIQGCFIGLDAYTCKLSSTILQSYAIDGGLSFGYKQLLTISGVLFGKHIWRKRELFV